MGWDDAVQVQLAVRTRQYAVRMSSSGTELWLGIGCKFTQWNPPSGRGAYTFRQDMRRDGYDPNRPSDQQDQQIRVHSWSQYEQEFGTFKQRFLSRVKDAFDDKLVLRHVSATTSNAGSTAGMSSYPDAIRCRLHLYEVSQSPHCSCLVYRAASRTTDRYSGNINMGGPRATCTPFATTDSILLEDGSYDMSYGNHNMFLSSNDINFVQITGGGGLQQMYAAHEMGHFLGLHHRCDAPAGPNAMSDPSQQQNVPESQNQPAAPTNQELQFDGTHPRAAQDMSPQTQDEYCRWSPNRGAVTDLMGFGMDINPWHGFAWHDVLQRISQGPGGLNFTQTSWTIERDPSRSDQTWA